MCSTSPVLRHLNSLQFEAGINNSAANIFKQIAFSLLGSLLRDIFPQTEVHDEGFELL